MKKVVVKGEVEEEEVLKQHLIVCAVKKRIKEMYAQWKWLYCSSAPYSLYDNIITAIAIVRHRCYTPLLVRQKQAHTHSHYTGLK